MAKSKAEIMRKSRDKKRDAGLVEFRTWCSFEARRRLQKLADQLEREGVR